ncbi:MAG: hypothetical protein L0H25_03865 [Micrococcales bacterium]|nr:hypothetical protein [Micrococcales bacterium]
MSIWLVWLSVVLVVADGATYLWLIHRQHEGGPAWWFVAGLCVVVILGIGGLFRIVPGPGVTWMVGGAMLLVLGIFSVGLPLLVAGVLMLIAAALRLRAGTASMSQAGTCRGMSRH